MIKFETALDIVLSQAVKVGTERVKIKCACGRYLAQDVATCCDLPPFDKSAVDGYACLRDDVLRMGNGAGLILQEVIPAGRVAALPIIQGRCSKIMTGAPLPKGAEVVLMVEQCKEIENGCAEIFLRADAEDALKLSKKSNICYRGEDIKEGGVLLKTGHLIRPQDVAVIATCGLSEVDIYRKVKIGIISTGSELLEPGNVPLTILPEGKIFNSNSWQLMALVESLGGVAGYYGIAPDNPQETEALMRRAVSENDVVLLSGGVSEGDFDFVADCMEGMGMKILFDRVAVQPGKPTTFAVSKIHETDKSCKNSHLDNYHWQRYEGHPDKYIFGLPGNPVSAYVQALLLVRPLMVSMQGGHYNESTFEMPLSVDYKRKNAERLAHIPVRILPDGTCSPIEYHGSAHISALTGSDALARIPIGVSQLIAGDMVQLILLP